MVIKIKNLFDGVVVFFQEHTSFTYQLLFGLTIILGLVFAVPTILYGAEEASTDTPLGVENQVSLSSVSLTLIERGYNPETNYAEIFLKVNGNLASRSKLDLIAGEEKNQVEVPAKIIRLTENYYTIQMSSIPNNWRNIIIDIAEISENDSAVEILDASKLFENFGVKKEKDKAKITQSQIYFNRKKVSIDTQAKPQNETMYLIKCLDMEIEESTKFIKNNKEAIVDFNKKIKTIEDEISDIESEKKYQTATEIKQAEDRIQSKKSTISDIKTKIESAKESNIELLEKISKLEQQKADVSSKE